MRASEILKEEQLSELFDSSASDLTQVTNTNSKKIWEFSVGQHDYRVSIIGSDKYYFDLYYGVVDGEGDVDFTPVHDQKEAFSVLGTVVSVVLNFLSNNKVGFIEFKGNKGAKLAGMYGKMAKLLKPKVEKLGFKIIHADGGAYDHFIIENTKFNFETETFIEGLAEHASGGGTSAGNVATSVGGLGAGFDPDADHGIYGKNPNAKKAKKPLMVRR